MDLAKLTTERRNPASAHIDSCSTLEMVTIMQQEDSKITAAIEKILPEIARAIDETSQRLERGESCAEMLPSAVLDYIREQGLYC